MTKLSGLFSLIYFSLIIANSSFAQDHNWITPGVTYLKMYVSEDGIFRINKTDFSNAGINPNSIDPRTVKLYNKGSQIPVFFFGESDGVFNDNDYMDFYGTRNFGGLTNTYDHNNNLAYTTNEYYNLYSDTNIYWIGWGGVNGLRYTNTNFNSTINYPDRYFYDLIHFEKDKIYSQGENISPSTDYRFLNTEKFKGEGWYWSLIGNNQSLSDTFSVNDLYNTTSENVSLKLFAYPSASSTSITNEHNLLVKVNGNTVASLFSNDFNRFDTTINFSSSLLSNTSVNTVTINYIPAPGFSGGVYFDYFEIKYPKLFKIRNNLLSFSTGSSDTTSNKFKVTGFNTINPINIYDVINNKRITSYTSSADTLFFSGKKNGRFELSNNNITKKPFRIIQRSVPDLVSNTNGADYLVIYNKLFTAQAEQLRGYRQIRDNFRSVKAETEDIYDIFNFGMENPVALKRFTKLVYDTWQLPKLKYICLFGRGSFDPKKNLTTSVYYKNLVPVYGYPNSDGYFSNLNTGSFFYYDMISIGRLPAYYVSEAQSMVDKIIAYESQPPDLWSKKFIYITGGGSYAEQQQHQQRSNFEINSYITSNNVSGSPVKIYRTDTSGTVTFNIADSVKNSINRGALFVNFRGHAGSHDWEVVMHDPDILSNGNKLPLILSLTCFTGENAKPDYRGFGERFLYLEGKGALGFVGTTGWSFTSNGNDFGTYITRSLMQDTTRRLGNFLFVAGKFMSQDSGIFNVRHTINCYNLLGDPAANLILPKFPEFSITNRDYKLSNSHPNQNEPVTLTIYPKNFGLFADSCKIRFQLLKNNQNYSFKDTVYRGFRYTDTVKYNFKLDSSGNYDMVVTLDKDNWYPLENGNNNSISINIPTINNTFVPLKPVDNSVVFRDSIEFTILNPNISLIKNQVKVIMQVDTLNSFNSLLLRTFQSGNTSGDVTKFKTLLPVLSNNTLYYWRTNSIVNDDSTGWSAVQKFIYNSGPDLTEGKMRFINSEIPVVLSKSVRNQFGQEDFQNTEYYEPGIKLYEFPATLFVRSYGSNGEEASYFSVGNQNVFIDAGMNTGLNFLKVKKLSGEISGFRNFKMTFSSSSDSLVNFLNTFDSTYYLMFLNAAYVPGGLTLSGSAKAKLRQFGSVYCDSIGLLGYFHTWSFIGYLGAGSSNVSEMFDPCCRTSVNCTACDHWTESISTMDVKFRKQYGTVSNIIGPAKTWTDFSWKQDIPLNSSLKFDVIGIDRMNNQTLIMGDLTTNEFSDISKIDAKLFPKINLLAKLSTDPASGIESPVLKSLKVNYTPAAELVIERNSLTHLKNAVTSVSTPFTFNYYNAGYVFINGTVINVFNRSVADSNLIFSDTVNSILKTDSMKVYSGSFTTPFFSDSTRIFIQIKPKEELNEFYLYNNTVDFSLTGGKQFAVNQTEVYCDGKKLNSGDNLRRNPEIKIIYSSRKKSSINPDTTALSVRLNNNIIPYFINGSDNPLINLVAGDNSGSDNSYSTVIFYPVLNTGGNKISFIIRNGADQNDTLNYDVNVTDGLAISDFYNFPNPMKSETNFIFNLEGSELPSDFKIRIYSVSGRVIREIKYPVNIGLNQIPWDGKDNDGDYVANGTYLYKIVIENENFTETKIQKLVVLK